MTLSRRLEGYSSEDDDSVDISDVFCKAETEKALLCVFPGMECWVPKSQVTDDSEVWRKGDSGKLVLRRWFVDKADLWRFVK